MFFMDDSVCVCVILYKSKPQRYYNHYRECLKNNDGNPVRYFTFNGSEMNLKISNRSSHGYNVFMYIFKETSFMFLCNLTR